MRTLLCKHEKGHLGQYEDWYYLVENEDGTRHVEHDWDHVTVNGLGKNEGTKTYTVEEFLDGNHYGKAKAELTARIK